MATLYVRGIPDAVYEQAQRIAQAQGRSLSAFVLQVLQQAVEEEKLRQVRSETLSSIRRRRRPLPDTAPDSVEVLRQIRAEHE